MEPKINFDSLVSQIEKTNEALQNNARLVINRHVTAKAWLTGYYIVEYEQNGSDRAKYGDRLLQNLSKRLGEKNFSYRSLKLYRQFFVTYVGLFEPIKEFVNRSFPIRQSLIAQFEMLDCQITGKSQSLTDLSMTITFQSMNLTFLPKSVWQSSCARRTKDLIRRRWHE